MVYIYIIRTQFIQNFSSFGHFLQDFSVFHIPIQNYKITVSMIFHLLEDISRSIMIQDKKIIALESPRNGEYQFGIEIYRKQGFVKFFFTRSIFCCAAFIYM
jgi:hypothetical protein